MYSSESWPPCLSPHVEMYQNIATRRDKVVPEPPPILLHGQPSTGRMRNLCMIAQITILISCCARFFPTQFIGPNENGMNAPMLWTNVEL